MQHSEYQYTKTVISSLRIFETEDDEKKWNIFVRLKYLNERIFAISTATALILVPKEIFSHNTSKCSDKFVIGNLN